MCVFSSRVKIGHFTDEMHVNLRLKWCNLLQQRIIVTLQRLHKFKSSKLISSNRELFSGRACICPNVKQILYCPHRTDSFCFDISSTQHLTIWAGNDLSSPPTKELHGLRVPSKFCVTRWGNKDQQQGREPWSSGYGKILTFLRSWVRILAPYTAWTLFHIYLL